MRGGRCLAVMVVTSTDNPMNESGDGPMRLGDEGPAVTNTDNAAGTPDFGDEDDGGSESVAHFMADVFGEWLDEDDNKKEMKFQDLKTWAEVRGLPRRSPLHCPVCASHCPCGRRAALAMPCARDLTCLIVPWVVGPWRGHGRNGAAIDLRPHSGGGELNRHLDALGYQVVAAR